MKLIITEEQNEKLNQKIKSMVNKFDIGHTIKFFDGNVDIIKHVYQDNPLEFLEQFNDLTPVEKGDDIFYVDKNGLPLFYYYHKKDDYVIINYYRIWIFFSMVMGFKRSMIEDIIKNWLEETYNLTDLMPYSSETTGGAPVWKNSLI